MKWVSFIPAASRRSVVQAAQDDRASVYLSGDNGSGKSAIARWIHQNSPRSARPLINFKSGDLIATRALEAENGTLVIQELHAFPIEEWAEIAKFIRTHSLELPAEPGEPPVRKMIRARIIATGLRPIQEFTAFAPLFPEFRVHLPSLRERGAELNDIIDNLLTEMAHELKRDHVRQISAPARAVLAAHPWRANFRELRNILRYGILKCTGALIEITDLPDLADPLLLGSRTEFLAVEEKLTAK